MRILIADDDDGLLRVLRASLEGDGHEVVCARNGSEALQVAQACDPDLAILDIMMPEMDGWETCLHLRSFSGMPIIFLTARDSETDVVYGLNSGADDYVPKPFSLAELRARIDATLRRAGLQAPASTRTYDDGTLYIDLQKNILRKRGQDIALAPKEFQVLACLVRRAGQVVSHGELLRQVWGSEFEHEIGYLTLYIRYVRRKLEDNPAAPRYLRTRFRAGYYFCPNGDSALGPDGPSDTAKD
jgi:two-component system, OmpR family, response regulator VicR